MSAGRACIFYASDLIFIHERSAAERRANLHCGSEIVTGDERDIAAKIFEMATERSIEVRIAYDGMKVRA